MTERKATAYLVLKARRSSYFKGDDGLKQVEGVSVTAVRQNRPARLERDEITVRVTVAVDDSAFSPVTADLALHIDPAHLIRPVVEALTPDALENGDQS
ncbi:hypothetical protein QLQ77_gp48 [Gordonia phage Reyja]|uniref:Uncharacterized protein n=1 Tax=Gordonia phage Reyja TaxID=2571250 RepID=A0A4D6TAR8_9CAUD|nr:hypothetical protein QLQ77_gp48 [Gordonia phage Reyja]QCG77794.1 hypothetical protein SEA_REYJA_48 [Gordonia phage Reyja]